MGNQNPRMDWDDLGHTIEQIVDRAIYAQDYRKLSQTIRQTVSRAVEMGSNAVRKASIVPEASSHAQYRSTKTVHVQSQKQPAQKENLPVLYGSSTGMTVGGILKTVGGGILTLGGFVDILVAGIVRAAILGGQFLTFSTVIFMGIFAGGVSLLTSGIRSLCRVGRFDKYKRLLGTKTYCELKKLASAVGKSTKFVKKELRGMIDQGLFLEGHIDDEETSLIVSDETFRHYQQTRLQFEEQKKLAEEQAQQRAARANSPVQEVLDRGNAFLGQIRRCNDAIPGEEISEKISHMEMIVKKIFDRAEAHPEIVPDLKKLMDYYLPMTVKLLNAYAEMDAQPIQGETIISSKREIEETLDTLNDAFEKLLDSVFRDTALDVSSDISVLQTLLAQEGLTEDGFSNL